MTRVQGIDQRSTRRQPEIKVSTATGDQGIDGQRQVHGIGLGAEVFRSSRGSRHARRPSGELTPTHGIPVGCCCIGGHSVSLLRFVHSMHSSGSSGSSHTTMLILLASVVSERRTAHSSTNGRAHCPHLLLWLLQRDHALVLVHSVGLYCSSISVAEDAAHRSHLSFVLLSCPWSQRDAPPFISCGPSGSCHTAVVASMHSSSSSGSRRSAMLFSLHRST
jgi:hypothetical protein